MMKYALGVVVGAWVMGSASGALAETTGPDDPGPTTGEEEPGPTTGDEEPAATVAIVSPADGASFVSSPLLLDVVVEASGVPGYQVNLLVDGVRDDGACEIDGVCTFSVELGFGAHELRAVIGDGDAFELASSAIVTVEVGPVELPTDTETGGHDTDDAETGDHDTDHPDTAADDDDDDSKGCAVDRSGPGSVVMLLGLGLLGWSRRRVRT